jgi:hypothetical protein
MRNPTRPSIFPKQIYSITHPRLRGRSRSDHAYSDAFPSLSSLAREFGGGKIGIYKLVRIAAVKREAKIHVGGKSAKVRGHLEC